MGGCKTVVMGEEDLTPSRSPGRRELHRVARTREYLSMALDIVTTEGFDALTMQRLADECESAIGAVYRYFPSKGALVAEIQREAVERLGTSYAVARSALERHVAGSVASDLDAAVVALSRVVHLGRWFISLSDTHPQELRLLQMLLSESRTVVPVEEGLRVVPSVMRLLDQARACVEEATALGALDDRDDAMTRVVVWAAGVGGVMHAGRLDVYDTELFAGNRLARALTHDLHLAWGGSPTGLAAAHRFVDRLESGEGPADRGVCELHDSED